MFSTIFLNKSNLIYNVNTLLEVAQTPICVMVKANAYGHGIKEVVQIIDNEIDCYGVSNQTEALELRNITNKKIIVFGKCEDYNLCISHDISFSLFSLKDAINIIKNLKGAQKPRFHLCVNSGMNRYGIRDKREYKKILALLQKKEIQLEGVYTHFSSLTTDLKYTNRQYEIFKEFVSLIPQDWQTKSHLGGGKAIFEEFEADMFRVGLEVYGYGSDLLKPVLSIESEIVNLLNVKKGEHVGYLCGFTADKNMKVATIPLGYADGFPRKLSNKLKVNIKGKEASNIGNICMDSFMVDVSKINCKVGDVVSLMQDASEFAKIIESTEYEVLSNLTKFRGERKIK